MASLGANANLATGSGHEIYIAAVNEVVNSLVKAYEAQVPINLSKIKG